MAAAREGSGGVGSVRLERRARLQEERDALLSQLAESVVLVQALKILRGHRTGVEGAAWRQCGAA